MPNNPKLIKTVYKQVSQKFDVGSLQNFISLLRPPLPGGSDPRTAEAPVGDEQIKVVFEYLRDEGLLDKEKVGTVGQFSSELHKSIEDYEITGFQKTRQRLGELITDLGGVDDFYQRIKQPKYVDAAYKLLSSHYTMPSKTEFSQQMGMFVKAYERQSAYRERGTPSYVASTGDPVYISAKADEGSPTMAVLPGVTTRASSVKDVEPPLRPEEKAVKLEDIRNRYITNLQTLPKVDQEGSTEFLEHLARMREEEGNLLANIYPFNAAFAAAEGMHTIATGIGEIYSAYKQYGSTPEGIERRAAALLKTVRGMGEVGFSAFLFMPNMAVIDLGLKAAAAGSSTIRNIEEWAFAFPSHVYTAMTGSEKPESPIAQQALLLGDIVGGLALAHYATKSLKSPAKLAWRRLGGAKVEWMLERGGKIVNQGEGKLGDPKSFPKEFRKRAYEDIMSSPGSGSTEIPGGIIGRNELTQSVKDIWNKFLGVEPLSAVEEMKWREWLQHAREYNLVREPLIQSLEAMHRDHQVRANEVMARRAANEAAQAAEGQPRFVAPQVTVDARGRLSEEILAKNLDSYARLEDKIGYLEELRRVHAGDELVQRQLEAKLRELDPGSSTVKRLSEMELSEAERGTDPVRTHDQELKAKSIVEEGGGEFVGIQRTTNPFNDQIIFNDPQTGSTLAVPLHRSAASDIVERMRVSREKFAEPAPGKSEPPPAEAPPAIEPTPTEPSPTAPPKGIRPAGTRSERQRRAEERRRKEEEGKPEPEPKPEPKAEGEWAEEDLPEWLTKRGVQEEPPVEGEVAPPGKQAPGKPEPPSKAPPAAEPPPTAAAPPQGKPYKVGELLVEGTGDGKFVVRTPGGEKVFDKKIDAVKYAREINARGEKVEPSTAKTPKAEEPSTQAAESVAKNDPAADATLQGQVEVGARSMSDKLALEAHKKIASSQKAKRESRAGIVKEYGNIGNTIKTAKRLVEIGATKVEATRISKLLKNAYSEFLVRAYVVDLATQIYKRLRPKEYARAKASLEGNEATAHGRGAIRAVEMMADEIMSSLRESAGRYQPISRKIGTKKLDNNQFFSIVSAAGVLGQVDDKDRTFLDTILTAGSMTGVLMAMSKTMRWKGKKMWNLPETVNRLRSMGLSGITIKDVIRETKRGIIKDPVIWRMQGEKSDIWFHPEKVTEAAELMIALRDKPFKQVMRQVEMNDVLVKHYSVVTEEVLDVLDPAFAGRGKPGSEAGRYKERKEAGVLTTYFYEKGSAIEPQFLGKKGKPSESLAEYHAVVGRLYPMDTDPLGLWERAGGDPTKFEILLKKNGSAGYYSVSGKVRKVAVFDPVEVVRHYSGKMKGPKKRVPSQPYVSIGGSPYREYSVKTSEGMTKEFEGHSYKKFSRTVDVLGERYDIAIKNKNEAAGIWWKGDGSAVLEPSMRLEVGPTALAAEALAAEIGMARNQASMYVFRSNPNGVDVEYAIKFNSFDQAFNALKRMNKFGLEGGAVDAKTNTLYIGDMKGQKISNLKNFLKDASQRKEVVNAKYTRGEISFLEQGEYEQHIRRYRDDLAARSDGQSGLDNAVVARTNPDLYATKHLGKINQEIIAAAEKALPKDARKLRYHSAALFARGITEFEMWRAEMDLLVKDYYGGKLTEGQMRRLYRDGYDEFFKRMEDSFGQMPSLTKLLELWHRGEPGGDWYSRAWSDLVEMFGEERAGMVADMIAATSANNSVNGNVALTIKAMKQLFMGEELTGYMDAHYGNLMRAVRGEPLSGPKVGNFSKNLKGDLNAVTVDLWMMRIFNFKGDKEGAPTPGQYEFISSVVTQIARETGETPAAVQARLWVGIKDLVGRKGDTSRAITLELRDRLLSGDVDLFLPKEWWRLWKKYGLNGLAAVAMLAEEFEEKGENIYEASLGGDLVKYGMYAVAAAAGYQALKRGLRWVKNKKLGAALKIRATMKDKDDFGDFRQRMEMVLGPSAVKDAQELFDFVSSFKTPYEAEGYQKVVKNVITDIVDRIERGDLPRTEMYREAKARVATEFANNPTFAAAPPDMFTEVTRKAYREIVKSLREHEGKPETAVEQSLRNITTRFADELDQIEAIATTGTYQPKEVREEFALGRKPSPRTKVNEDIIEYLKESLFRYKRTFEKMQDQAKAGNDPAAQVALEVATKKLEDLLLEWKEVRAAWGRSGHALQRGISDIHAIIDAVDSGRIGGKRAGLLDRLLMDVWDTAKKGVGKEGDPTRTVDAKLSNAINYLRVNLFTIGTWTLDLLTNSIAGGQHAIANTLVDLAAIAGGNASFNRTAGLINSIGLQGRGVFNAIKNRTTSAYFRLSPAMEAMLGSTVGGEFVGTMTNARVAGVPLDYVIAPHVRLKGFVDRTFGRTFTLAELIKQGRQEARRLGKKGREFDDYVHEFVSAQTPETAAGQRALRIGREVKFNRELTTIEEEFGKSKAIQLLFDPFPRFKFQYTRWVGESLGLDPKAFSEAVGAFKSVMNGKTWERRLTAEDWTEYLVKAATGWGGLMFVSQTLYDDVDFTTMMYIREDGKRVPLSYTSPDSDETVQGQPVRLSGRSPLPEALVLVALLRGDYDKFSQGLQHTAFFFGSSTATSRGLLGDIISLVGSRSRNEVTQERFREDMNDLVNRALPGQSVLGFTSVMLEYGMTGKAPIRKGLGANIPGYAQAATEARVNPTTGEPEERFQYLPGTDIAIPSTGGTVLPGATIIYSPLEREALRLGVATYRGRRSPLPAYVDVDIREDYNRRFQELRGRYFNMIGSELIHSREWRSGEIPYDMQRKLLTEAMTEAFRITKEQIYEETGYVIPETLESLRDKLLPEKVRRQRIKEWEEIWGVDPQTLREQGLK